MSDPDEPIQLDEFRQRKINRSPRSFAGQLGRREPADGSRLGLAIASVVARRRWHDWAWLDEDVALHRP
jgi:hypothetical protein